MPVTIYKMVHIYKGHVQLKELTSDLQREQKRRISVPYGPEPYLDF